MKFVICVVGVVILVVATALSHYLPVRDELAFEGLAFNLPVWSTIFTALVMLMGIVFGSLFRRLEGRKEPINPMHELRDVFCEPGFLAALCVSPFVFLVVYSMVQNSPGDAASYFLAFENGFFCEAIFKRMFPSSNE